MEATPYEIERKFLIQRPDPAWLSARAEASRISQTYLLAADEQTSERVRCRAYADRTVYTHTVKTHVSAVRRIEIEKEITRAEYERLRLRADPARRTIEKTRYCLRQNDLVYEIDVFPFWQRQAFLEVELQEESQPIPWPEEIVCLREVTEDPAYTNSALARAIPEEEL